MLTIPLPSVSALFDASASLIALVKAPLPQRGSSQLCSLLLLEVMIVVVLLVFIILPISLFTSADMALPPDPDMPAPLWQASKKINFLQLAFSKGSSTWSLKSILVWLTAVVR